MRPFLALAALAAGCAYRPGSFSPPGSPAAWPGEHATVGCLDIATHARPAGADRVGQVVAVWFANRCDHAITIDFTTLRATGRDAEGRELSLAIHDPDHQLRPLPLEARLTGHEVFELRSASQPDVPIRSACLDVAALVADAPAERWVCVVGGTAQVAAGEAGEATP